MIVHTTLVHSDCISESWYDNITGSTDCWLTHRCNHCPSGYLSDSGPHLVSINSVVMIDGYYATETEIMTGEKICDIADNSLLNSLSDDSCMQYHSNSRM